MTLHVGMEMLAFVRVLLDSVAMHGAVCWPGTASWVRTARYRWVVHHQHMHTFLFAAQQDGRCITDGLGNYGNDENCTFTVLSDAILEATEFVTESCE